jgi:mannose-6-phosphate isomerase
MKREVVAAAAAADIPAREAVWVKRLTEQFPGDVGVLSPLILNLVELEPGQAMYLDAGEPHAYLEGVGVELMANSDNVLRGGLTSKHVDVEELIRILTFEGGRPEVLEGETRGSTEIAYETPSREFALSRISTGLRNSFRSVDDHTVEILLCIDGRATVACVDEPGRLEIAKGQSVFVRADSGKYRIDGDAVLYRAAVPPA